MGGGPMKLGQVFDPRNNALNAWRLVLATSVILCHSFGLTGRVPSSAAAHQLLDAVGVDGFFAISGFLVTSSWFRQPRIRDYFVARGLRILPGYYICLIVTAFVIAPVGVAIQGAQATKLLLSTAPIEYVLANSTVAQFKFDIGGTPDGIPVPHMWNGSLWTLVWELLCYIAVAGFGVVGLLRRRWFLPIAMALTLCWAALLPPVRAGETLTLELQQIASRFGVMFLAGALVYQFRDVIPVRWWLVALSIVIVLAAGLLPNYRLVAAIPLAYAIIVSGALIRNRRSTLEMDLSYGLYIYACPIQQILVICGLGFLNPTVFAMIATIATLPLAALSWFLVEKRGMALKSRLKRKMPAPALPEAFGECVSTAADLSIVVPDAAQKAARVAIRRRRQREVPTSSVNS
jgi:peptidoglycan/LPS O-acetylase OafA/YrhL